jgi:hypothetical protein
MGICNPDRSPAGIFKRANSIGEQMGRAFTQWRQAGKHLRAVFSATLMLKEL